MQIRNWNQPALLLTLSVSLSCAAATGETPESEVRAQAAPLLGLRCALTKPLFTDPVGPLICQASVTPGPGQDNTEERKDCDGGFQAYIGIRAYETSFNVKSFRSWQDGLCDWGHLGAEIVCSKDGEFGWLGEPPNENVFSDSLDIAIEPGGYSATSLQLSCPSHIPFVARARSSFEVTGTVPVVNN
jgi:hypothetical protein